MEQMEEKQSKAQRFMELQKLPYENKIVYAISKACEFYDRLNGKVFCSVGGLDSITLLLFLRKYVDPDIPGVTVSSLEDKSIQQVHRQLDNMVFLRPYKSKVRVIREHGYPIISKDIAGKIQLLQNPTEKNATVRHAIMTGQTGEQGGYKKSPYMELPQKWKELFAGLENVKKFLLANDLSKVEAIFLLHLSDNNSNAERFKREVQELTGRMVFIA